MKITKIKESLKDLKFKILDSFKKIKIKFNNLRDVNIWQALDYFELGILSECHNRLKIILKLWPDDDYAKYLIGLVYTINRDNYDALKYLESVKDFKKDYSEKLKNIIIANKSEKIIDIYKENFNLDYVESKISEIQI